MTLAKRFGVDATKTALTKIVEELAAIYDGDTVETTMSLMSTMNTVQEISQKIIKRSTFRLEMLQ